MNYKFVYKYFFLYFYLILRTNAAKPFASGISRSNFGSGISSTSSIGSMPNRSPLNRSPYGITGSNISPSRQPAISQFNRPPPGPMKFNIPNGPAQRPQFKINEPKKPPPKLPSNLEPSPNNRFISIADGKEMLRKGLTPAVPSKKDVNTPLKQSYDNNEMKKPSLNNNDLKVPIKTSNIEVIKPLLRDDTTKKTSQVPLKNGANNGSVLNSEPTETKEKSSQNEAKHKHPSHSHEHSPHSGGHSAANHQHKPHSNDKHKSHSKEQDHSPSNAEDLAHSLKFSNVNSYPRIEISGNTARIFHNEYDFLSKVNHNNINNNSAEYDKFFIIFIAIVAIILGSFWLCFIYACIRYFISKK